MLFSLVRQGCSSVLWSYRISKAIFQVILFYKMFLRLTIFNNTLQGICVIK